MSVGFGPVRFMSVSRLYDRIQAKGIKAYSVTGDFHDVVEEIRLATLDLGETLTEAQLERGARFALEKGPKVEAIEVLHPRRILGVPVIVGDAVAAYTQDLRGNLDDLVTTLAPPFDRFFVEFQGVRGENIPYAWGVLVEVLEPEEGFGWDGFDPELVEWEIRMTLLLEPAKGLVHGPVATYYLALDSAGEWLRDALGKVVWKGEHVAMSVELPDDPHRQAADNYVPLVFPALMTISLMHCRNVEVRTVHPPAALAKKHSRKRGAAPVRYHVLDIEPIRRILDTEGGARTHGLGRALHLCRGHFKTFRSDAPLFGKHVGMYWWTPQARGRSERGVVTKDYRMRLAGEHLGESYREAKESIEVGRPPAGPDQEQPSPDTYGRGLRAHNRTQNLLAEALRAAGFDPRSPAAGDDSWDSLWHSNGEVWVAEVKSITRSNEERQLRLAVGQVKRYAQGLVAAGLEVRTMIAVECHPFDETWIDLCNAEGIVLAWPEVFADALGR